ncbi:MAG TPA: GTP-binding protein [Gemmatimonadales bacterium]
MSRRVPAATPVTIISGYLGAGKTTLVNSLLSRCAGRQVAVVVNDFGSIPIDPALMAGTDALSVSHGCACCTRAGDLLLALARLLSRHPAPEQVLIEASGVSDPRRIADTVILHGLRLDGIVALADAEAVRSHGDDAMVGPWVRHQLGAADLIVLNKTDLVSGAERSSVRHWISDVAPGAHVVETSQGRVPVSLVLAGPDADEPAVAQRPTGQGRPAHPEFGAWGCTLATPLDGAAFRWWAASLPEPILRGKGVLFLAEDPRRRYVFQLVGGRWSLECGEPWENEPRRSRITLIGPASGMDERWLDMTIARCVAGQARRGA